MGIRSRTRLAAGRGDDRGAVAVVVALFLVVFIILIAFVVDFGRQFTAESQLQNAVDAGALAGAQDACTSLATAEETARTYAALNGATNPVAVATESGGVRTVTVSASQPIDTVFGRVANVNQLGVNARAAAGASCGIIFSVFTATDFKFNGTGTSGYTLYYRGTFSYASSGGQQSVFDGIFAGSLMPNPGDPVPGPIPAGITPPTATPANSINAEQFYQSLYNTNSSYLPPPQAANDIACWNYKVGNTDFTGAYATEALFRDALRAPNVTINCALSKNVNSAYSLPTDMAAAFITDARLRLADVNPPADVLSGTLNEPPDPPRVRSPLIATWVVPSNSGDVSISVDKVYANRTVFYAPKGRISVSEAAPANQKTVICTVIAEVEVIWNGGRQQAGCVNPVLLPGTSNVGVTLTE